MREKCRFWIVTLAFLSLFVVFAPHAALADSGLGTATTLSNGDPGPYATDECPNNNEIDTIAENNRKFAAQERWNQAHNVGTAFPVQAAMSNCVSTLLELIATLPSLTNPFSPAAALLKAIVSQVLTSVINQVCAATMGTITSIQNSLVNLTRICLPLPTFGGLNLPQWSATSCSGGITFTPLSFGGSTTSGWSSAYSSSLPRYNERQYLK